MGRLILVIQEPQLREILSLQVGKAGELLLLIHFPELVTWSAKLQGGKKYNHTSRRESEISDQYDVCYST